MSQLACNIVAPAGVFKRFGPRHISRIYACAPVSVPWKTGAPDSIVPYVSAVVLPGTGKQVNLTGTPYVLFTWQGLGALRLAPGDNAGNLDSLVPAGAQWGIFGWWDASGYRGFQQF